MSENHAFVQAFLKNNFLFPMGRAREQTKRATFPKNISQWVEQENAKNITIFKKNLFLLIG